MERELALRAHIRAQVLDYVNEHINIDHAAYSEHIATQLLSSSLHPVPEYDATSLTLPEEPIDVFLRLHGLTAESSPHSNVEGTAIPEPKPPPYAVNEKTVLTEKTKTQMLSLQREFAKAKGATPKSDRVMWDDDSDDKFEPPRPLSPPIMTRKSIRNSPSMRLKRASGAEKSTDLAGEMKKLSLKPVEVPPEEQLDQDALLGVRTKISASQIEEMTGLASRLTRGRRMDKTTLSAPARQFLYDDSLEPPGPHSLPPPLSPPIFPRRSAVIKDTKASAGHWDRETVANFIKSAAPKPDLSELESKDDEAMQNMAIIDGRSALMMSEIEALLSTSHPPSLVAPSSETGLGFDEIFWNSTPPDPQPAPEVLLSAYKLDDVEIPRAHRPRSGLPIDPASVAFPTRESFHDFLLPAPDVQNAAFRKGHPIDSPALAPVDAMSVVGEPPTEVPGDSVADAPIAESATGADLAPADDLDDVIRSIYAPIREVALDDMLFEEPSTKQEDSLRLQVPRMPSPNRHAPPTLVPPSTLAAMVPPKRSKGAKSAAKPDASTKTPSAFQLVRANGLVSLTMELDWRPTISGTHAPTHEELAGVSPKIDEGVFLASMEEVVLGMRSKASRNPPYLRGAFDEDDTHSAILEATHNDGLILTRAERRLVQGFRPLMTDTPSADAPEYDELFAEASTIDATRRVSSPPNVAPTVPAKRRFDFEDSDALPLGTRPRHAHSRSPPSQDISEDLRRDPLAASKSLSPSIVFEGTADSAEALIASHAASPLGPESKDYIASNLASAPLARFVKRNVVSEVAGFRHLQRQTAASVVPAEDERAKGPEIAEISPLPNEEPELPNKPQVVIPNPALALPSHWTAPRTVHRYLASVIFIQKRALARALSSPDTACVELVEGLSSDHLENPDLILDMDTAIVFFPVLHLPSAGRELTKRLKSLSTSYRHLLVILEGFPSARSIGVAKTAQRIVKNLSRGGSTATADSAMEVDVFSPPVLIALKRFRRDLAIERELSSGTGADVVCALDVREAAIYARMWGDLAEERCDERWRHHIWGERDWLGRDDDEDVSALATYPGMNEFASLLLTAYVNTDELLEMSEDARLQHLGPVFGHDRIVSLNRELTKRAQAFSSLSPPISSLADDTLYAGLDDVSSTTLPPPTHTNATHDSHHEQWADYRVD